MDGFSLAFKTLDGIADETTKSRAWMLTSTGLMTWERVKTSKVARASVVSKPSAKKINAFMPLIIDVLTFSFEAFWIWAWKINHRKQRKATKKAKRGSMFTPSLFLAHPKLAAMPIRTISMGPKGRPIIESKGATA